LDLAQIRLRWRILIFWRMVRALNDLVFDYQTPFLTANSSSLGLVFL